VHRISSYVVAGVPSEVARCCIAKAAQQRGPTNLRLRFS
jgi:hypothetical protein